MNRNQLLKLVVLTVLFFPFQGFAQRSAPRYAIKNVTVISMIREEAALNQTVLLDSGYISKIGGTKETKIDKGYTVIDGTGKYLLPGLFDMSTQFFQDGTEGHVNTTQTELKLMLANGIITARVIGEHPDHLIARDNVRNGKWTGPVLTVVSPAIVSHLGDLRFNTYELQDAVDFAISSVKRFKRQGYEAINVNWVIPEILDAVVKTAREENIKVVGYAGSLVKLPKVLEAKLQIENLAVFVNELLPKNSYHSEKVYFDADTQNWADWSTVKYLDESKIPELVQAAKKAGIFVTPNNSAFPTSPYFSNEDEIKQKPDYEYLPSKLKTWYWWVRKMAYEKPMAPIEPLIASQQKYLQIRKEIVYELWKAGVPLMTGSDGPGYFRVNGFSIHDELSAMVDAGLTPYAALQTATINPATFLNMDQWKGTIEVGKEANLLLLNKNPLTDIHNTRSIVSVFKGFIWYDQSALNKLLEEAKILGK